MAIFIRSQRLFWGGVLYIAELNFFFHGPWGQARAPAKQSPQSRSMRLQRLV
jgi:hypothetical protein